MERQRRWVAFAVPLAVVLVAAGLRLWRLGSPPQLYWDEQYYVFDAEVYLGGGLGQPIQGAPDVKIADEGTWVHPPLGKWIIALLGVGPLGLRSIGWRLPSALFGIAGVAVLYLLALQLWESIWWAGMAAGLLALDGLHIVQSRIAMLDIFVTTFVMAGVLFLVLDRKSMGSEVPEERRLRVAYRWFGSPYRFWAGFVLGAAVACKWVGVFALALSALLCATWLLTSTEGRSRSRVAEAATLVASFFAVPLLVYLASYGAFFYQHGPAFHDFVTLQLRMLAYHAHHTKVQPQNSLPWTWPLLLHPIQYFGQATGGSVRRIVALGNPAVWWGFLLLLPVAVVTTIRKPQWQDAVVFGGYLVLFVPWLFVGRSQFIFYMLPAVPFMCLAFPNVLRKLPAAAGRALAVGFGVAVLVGCGLYAPLWIGSWISRAWAGNLRLLPGWWPR